MVRQVNLTDLPRLADYEADISQISFGEAAITDVTFHLNKIKKAISKEQNGMLVLEVNGEISGWLWMAVKTNFLTGEKYVNFKSFYISPEYRGSHYVNELLDAGLEYCRQESVQRVVGHVHVSNLGMRVLYKEYGFQPTHLTMEYFLSDDRKETVCYKYD